MSVSEYLFVYGSLRRNADGELHPLLQNSAEFMHSASIPGLLFDVGDYPGVIYTPPEKPFRVQGEIYRIHAPEVLLAILDEYEECNANFPAPHEYRRCRIAVDLSADQTLPAWVYLYNRPISGLKWIASGDYVEFWQTAALLRE